MATVSVQEFEKALSALREGLNFTNGVDAQTYKIGRDACIQRFEVCVELAWKTSAKILGSSSTTAKPVIREMAQNHLIQDVQMWFDFIEARNKSSHTYDEVIAKEVFEMVQKFMPEGENLLKNLNKK